MISYRLVQNKSSNPKMTGKWYARVVTGKREKVFLSGARVQRYKEYTDEGNGNG